MAERRSTSPWPGRNKAGAQGRHGAAVESAAAGSSVFSATDCHRTRGAFGTLGTRLSLHGTNYRRRTGMLRERGIERWRQAFDGIAARGPHRAPVAREVVDYAIDFARRWIMTLDVLRRRGNEFIEYEATGQPPLLAFDYEVLIDGRKLAQPVNYCLVRIIPPRGSSIDQTMRPYLIIDPRAGHGAGIGGFKQESQVGVALREGNPVYMTVFYPEPEPGQTLARVAAAQLQFVREVARRHPDSPKPALVGNCQGGWAVMALAALDPEISGPIVLNGAPLSYWAGVHGDNPLRYMGGLSGGSWPAYLLGDLGNGRFDGAWLVQNFESMNPANTLWSKYYRLFANVDIEAPRFLDFEKWWGGFVLLTREEMRGIVDDLFVGNKLSTGGIPLGRGQTLDLRRVRSPMVVFCSHGDDITPPQQALNWIADTYVSSREIKAHGQTIVYIVHADVGHLGIFVSGSVVRREFSQIAGTLAAIEKLPPGLYELSIEDAHIDRRGLQHYDVSLHEREIDDILVHDDSREDEHQFQIVAAISELNARFYDLVISPWVRMMTNEWSACWMRELHPMRMQRYAWSDFNPCLWWLEPTAAKMRGLARPVTGSNPLLAVQANISALVEAGLDSIGDARDAALENAFHALYGSLQMMGVGDRRGSGGFAAEAGADLSVLALAGMTEGGVREAVLRMLLLLMKASGSVRRETLAHVESALRGSSPFKDVDAATLRSMLVAQNTIVAYEPERALETLPDLLPDEQLRTEALAMLTMALPPDAEADPALRASLQRFKTVLGRTGMKNSVR